MWINNGFNLKCFGYLEKRYINPIHYYYSFSLSFYRIQVMTWLRLFLAGRRNCSVITYWTDCSPSPSSLLASLLSVIRLVTQSPWIRDACRTAVCHCWPVTLSRSWYIWSHWSKSSTALSGWYILAKVFYAFVSNFLSNIFIQTYLSFPIYFLFIVA